MPEQTPTLEQQLQDMYEKSFSMGTDQDRETLRDIAKQRGITLRDPQSWFDKYVGSKVGPAAGWAVNQVKDFGEGMYKTLEGAKVVPKVVGELTSGSNPWEGLKNAWNKTIEPAGWGMLYEDPARQLAQVPNDFRAAGDPNRSLVSRGANALAGVRRAATGWVPVVGPLYNQSMDELAKGEVGKSSADLVQLLGMAAGPEAAEATSNKVIGGMSKNRMAAAVTKLPGWEDIPVDRQAAIQKMIADNPGIMIAKRGVQAQPEVNKVSQLIDEAMNGVRQEVNNYQGPPMRVKDITKHVEDLFREYDKAGLPELAEPAKEMLVSFIENHTGMPANRSKAGVLTETPSMYMKRVDDAGVGQSLPYWQDVKQALGKIEKENMAVKTKAEVAESGLSRNVLNTLLERGARDAIRERVPGIQKWNDIASAGISLRKMMQDFSQTNPKAMNEILPFIMGGLGAEIAGAIGFHGGGMSPLQYGAVHALSIPMMTGFIMRAASRDPAINARLASVLDKYNRGGASSVMNHVVGNLPRARAVQESAERNQR